MDAAAIRAKFGLDYAADERTFLMGIGQRFTARIAERFGGRTVLETCTGGGFTTIALARVAAHVITTEIEPAHQAQARHNVAAAGVLDRVTFVLADIMDEKTWDGLPPVDAAFLDPVWVGSWTSPPADALLARTFRATPNVALIMPPYVDVREFEAFPPHELQRLYLGERHELYCLYFGELAGPTRGSAADQGVRLTRL